MEPILSIENLTKYYGKHKGVENLELKVNPGEIFGFIGPNGAGKSTTIRTVLGLLKPTSGEVFLLGEKVTPGNYKLRQKVGYMPSEASFYEDMKVADVLKFSASFYREDCGREAESLCDRLKLNIRKKICELSLGNRKKVSIVCALQHFSELYILDEPTSGLDPLMQKEFFEILKEKNDKGAAIFLSSHILSEIQKYCHRAAMIRDGKLLMEDNVSDLCHSSAKQVVLYGVERVPESLEISAAERGDNSVSFLYRGEIPELMKALCGLPITDLTISEPDLEDIFLHFYQGGQLR